MTELGVWNKKTGTKYVTIEIINDGLAEVTTEKTNQPYIVKRNSLTSSNPKESYDR